MKNRKIEKIILIISIFLLALTANNIIYASSGSPLEDVFSDASDFIKQGDPSTAISTSSLKEPSDLITNILLGVATLVSVVTITILGISFMIQSAEGKAEIKQAIIPLVIGIIVSFGAFTIWKAIINIFAKI